MYRIKRSNFSQMSIFGMILLGFILIAISAFYISSFLAILGSAIIFWGVILVYVTPSKYVPLTLVNASAEIVSANIERLIFELNLSEKGVYLPPKNLGNVESSLVFIPKTPKVQLPTPEEINKKQLANQKNGAFVTPPGAALSRQLEVELGVSFAKTDLQQVQKELPILLVERLELAEEAEIQIQDSIVILKIIGSIFDEICRKTNSQPKTHEQVGCFLSSAIACTLAKASGKPVIIQNETRNQESKTSTIEYQMLEV